MIYDIHIRTISKHDIKLITYLNVRGNVCRVKCVGRVPAVSGH